MKISREKYFQLRGLVALAEHHNKALNDIHSAALVITQEKRENGETETSGHTSDAIYGERSTDDLIRLLHIEVTE